MKDSGLFSVLKQNVLLHILILISLAIFAYSNSFQGAFIFDDFPSIVNNPGLRNITPLNDFIFNQPKDTSVSGRLLPTLSFAVNYHISGLNVFSYHLFNILFHILCGITIYFVILEIFRLRMLSSAVKKDSARLIAFCTASLWLVHPINSEAVCYLTQRTEIMMSLAYLGTIYFTVKSINTNYSRKWMLAGAVFSVLGAGCKESIMTAPFVCTLLILISEKWNVRKLLKKYYILLTGFLINWIFIALIMLNAPRGESVGFGTGSTAFLYAVNQIHMISTYLKLIVFPFPLNIDYGLPRSYTIVETIFPLIFLLLCLVGIVFLWKKNIMAGFAALCFFIIISPTSSFVPISTEVGSERRVYLASAFLLILIVTGVFKAIEHFKLDKRIAFATYLIILIGFTSATICRTLEYKDPLFLWLGSLQIQSDNPRALNTVGLLYSQRGELNKAEKYLLNALKHDSGNREILINLGGLELRRNNYSKAAEYCKLALAGNPEDIILNMNLAGIYAIQLNPKAIDYYKKVLKIEPDNYQAAFSLAVFYERTKDNKNAEKYFFEAVRLSDENPEIIARCGAFLFNTGKKEKGIEYLRKANKKAPENNKITDLLRKKENEMKNGSSPE